MTNERNTTADRRLFRHLRTHSAVALALLLSAGAATAQPSRPGGPLRGPSVEDNRPPAVERSFGAERDQRPGRVSPQGMRQIIAGLTSPEAREQLDLSEEQVQRIEQHVADFRAKTREHMEHNRERMEELRREMRDRRGAMNEDGVQGEPPRRGGDDDMRARLQEMRDGAPSPDDLLTRIYSELTPRQRERVEARIAEAREQFERQREERYVRERMGRGQNDAESPMAPRGQRPEMLDGERPGRGMQRGPADMERGREGRPGPRGFDRPDRERGADAPDGRPQPDRLDRERRERLLHAFSKLTPEQQDRLLQRLEAMQRGEGREAPAPSNERQPARRRGRDRDMERDGNTPPPARRRAL